MDSQHARNWPPPPPRELDQGPLPQPRPMYAPPPTMQHSTQQSPPSSMGGPQSSSAGHYVPYHAPPSLSTSLSNNLPPISGLTGPPSRDQSLSARPSQPYSVPQSYSNGMVNLSASTSYSDGRSRGMQDVHIKEEQDAFNRRNRDDFDAQRLDHLPQHQAQPASLHLHQPVALGRTANGPNGLLADSGPGANSNHSQMGAPLGPSNMFGGPVQSMRPQSGPSAQPAMPQGPANAQTANGAAANLGPGQQPILNDALSYLDQVKVQFNDHPDVYNRFLDIMKDFKSGAIDTPGVIDRVSNLFAGHPNLIQGFNTFLPPGYRIECGTGDDPNTIRVTTPMGNTLLSTMPMPKPLTPPNGRGQVTQQSTLRSPNSHAQTERDRETQAAVHQQEQRGVSSLTNAVSAATREYSPRDDKQGPKYNVGHERLQSPPRQPAPDYAQDSMEVDVGGEKRAPIEFNHAISYVNKIKNRFASQPDIYKQFLEILQTYQRESKPIQDVFGQVTKLFHTAPDLLVDFKQFLPESAAQAKAVAAARQHAEDAAMLSNVRGDPNMSSQQTPRAEHRLPPVGNFAPTPSTNKDAKRKRADRQGTVTSLNTNMHDPSLHGKGGLPGQGNASKRAKYSQSKPASAIEMAPLSPTLVPALPEPLGPSHSLAATVEELGFFDRAKKSIGNKSAATEFLKLCNLFAQDLIDRATLIHRARSFLGGNPDLFKWFQTWVGYTDADTVIIENKERIPSGRVLLSNCRALGPSYRLLPKRERLKTCSGRDELCNEVLNDDWASHPTWASEDSGFIAHRKNIHEEGLHKIEEERHDYDHNIEACGRTIQLLEPIAQKLLQMPEKDRDAVEVHAGIGGQSETIHKKIIMKLYGRDKGQQVIDQLATKPYAVIPILLNRLKQKQEEWKTAQREWEKVWRDQTQKMFWKSLDHQAVNAKQADKRQFQTKTLIAEVQTRHEEQKKQRLLGATAGQVSQPQFSVGFDDIDVIVDATHLVLTYAEQMHSTEYPRLTTFIKEFVPLFFELDTEWFNAQLQERLGSVASNGYDSATAEDATGSKPRRANGKKDDLRRGVLERGTRGRNLESSATPMSRASTPDPSVRADEEMSDEVVNPPDDESDHAMDTWAEYPPGLNKFKNRDVVLNEPYKRDTFNLYGNASIYCFLRMFVILYERLNKLKQEEDAVRETVRRAMMAKPAIELGLVDKLPTDFFSDVHTDANFYRQILDMLETFVASGTDFAPIEETLRRYYLESGWQLYSFDKLCSALVRFAIGVMSSDSRDKSWDVLQCFKKNRSKEETTYQEEMTYRKQVERLVKDGDIYKIAYDHTNRQLSIKLFKKDEPTFDVGRLMAEDMWRVYVTDFLGTGPTHGSPIEMVSVPLMKRNVALLCKDDQVTTNVAGDEGSKLSSAQSASTGRRIDLVRAKESLEFKIAIEDLGLHFNANSEEYFHQPVSVRIGADERAIKDAEATVEHRAEDLANGKLESDLAARAKAKANAQRDELFASMVSSAVPAEQTQGDTEMAHD